jgi:hypothetical protein
VRKLAEPWSSWSALPRRAERGCFAQAESARKVPRTSHAPTMSSRPARPNVPDHLCSTSRPSRARPMIDEDVEFAENRQPGKFLPCRRYLRCSLLFISASRRAATECELKDAIMSGPRNMVRWACIIETASRRRAKRSNMTSPVSSGAAYARHKCVTRSVHELCHVRRIGAY